MKILGFEINRTKALSPPIENRGGWFPIVSESFAGSWQQNVEVDRNMVLSYPSVFACMTRIAQDVAKLRIKFIREGKGGVWVESSSPHYSPLLNKPNAYQTRTQFWEYWMLSRLMRGNVYALKGRDGSNRVRALYILDPDRTQVLVSETGEVYYRLGRDNMSGITKNDLIVPASEIIHDRCNCLFHPLVGVPPLFANGVAATQGLNMQDASTKFFQNGMYPGGVLTAPAAIENATAQRLKDHWDANYSGANAGKIAVLGDGLKFEPLTMKAEDAQLIEQARFTAEVVVSTFHVPLYKIGIGLMPSGLNLQALNIEYYNQALQKPIEDIEAALDHGLEMGPKVGVEFDTKGLWRMDSISQIASLKEAVLSGIISPNEAREDLGYGPTAGGDSPRMQQQQFTLEALAERDRDKPFAKPALATPATPATPGKPTGDDDSDDDSDDSDEAPKSKRVRKLPTKKIEAYGAQVARQLLEQAA